MDGDVEFRAGTLLNNRYRVERELGRGAFGIVYLARDTQLHDRRVVIKQLARRFGRNQSWAEGKFRQECEALAKINHPGVVGILDQGDNCGQPFIVMQFVDGPQLKDLLKAGPLAISRAATLTWEIAEALTAAHDQFVYHRDLKPENIMLRTLPGNRTMAVIVDFGIAGVHAQPQEDTGPDTVIADTPAYMAPEHLDGRPRLASDIYSLGVVIYEIVTGRRPYEFRSPADLFQKQKSGIIVNPREHRPDLPEAAANAILKALAFQPEDRFPRALDLAEAFVRGLGRDAEGAGEGIAELLSRMTVNPLEQTVRAMLGGLGGALRDFVYEATLLKPDGTTESIASCVKLPDLQIRRTASAGGGGTTVAIGNAKWYKPQLPSGRTGKLGVRDLAAFEVPAAAGVGKTELLVQLASLDLPGTKVQSVGEQEFHGKKAQVVAVTREELPMHLRLYIDPDTHLVVGRTSRAPQLDTLDRFEDVFSDYRPVDGAMVPFQMVSGRDDKVSRTQILSMRMNGGLTDELFEKMLAEFRSDSDRMKKAGEALQKGYALLRQNQFQLAVPHFTEAATLKPDYFEAHKCLGFCHFCLQQLDRALEDFNRALEFMPGDVEALFRRGSTYQLLNQPARAISDLTEAIKGKPDYADAYRGRAFVYRSMQQYEDAESDFGQLIRLKPGFADCYFHRGLNRLAAKQQVKAIEDFTESIRLAPHNALSWFQRGGAHIQVRAWDRARDDFTMAIQLNPAEAEAYICRGIAYFALQQYALVVADDTEAIRLKPGRALAYWDRGAAREKLGDRDGAGKDRAKALELGYKPATQSSSAT